VTEDEFDYDDGWRTCEICREGFTQWEGREQLCDDCTGEHIDAEQSTPDLEDAAIELHEAKS